MAAAADSTPAPKLADVILFYSDKEGNPFREFSNFYRHSTPFDFRLPAFARRDGFPASVPCQFSEKAIMLTKAALMHDRQIFQEIVEAQDPKSCKALGRGVRNFDEGLWQEHLEEVAFEVVSQKFQAEPALRRVLLSTGRSVIAEAAPNDRIWGIGLSLKDARAKDPEQWQGRNVLGSALMRAREHLARGGGPPEGSGPDAASSASAPPPELPEAAVSAPEAALEAVGCAGRADAGGAAPSGSAAFSESAPRGATEPEADAAAPAFDCFAVLDFEATCEDGRKIKPQEVIEFPLVLVDARTRLPVDEFRTYVRPLHRPRLTAFCTRLTGIAQGDVDGAPPWTEALTAAEAWLEERLESRGFRSCALVTCGDWDLKTMMREQCQLSGNHVPGRFQRWVNIKRAFTRLMPSSGGDMPTMLRVLGLELEGRHHSGLDDSRNIARILGELLSRGPILESDLNFLPPGR